MFCCLFCLGLSGNSSNNQGRGSEKSLSKNAKKCNKLHILCKIFEFKEITAIEAVSVFLRFGLKNH